MPQPTPSLSFTYVIDGMSCAACAGRVTRALQSVPGVKEATVNLVTQKAQVIFETSPLHGDIAVALSRAGYRLVESQANVSIDGMSCASCVGRVERTLLAVPGVISANVNLTTNSASVRYATGSTSAPELAAAITRSGYPAQPRRSDEVTLIADRQALETSALRRRFFVALMLSAPVIVMTMGSHAFPALHYWINTAIGERTAWIIQSILTLAVIVGPGRIFLAHGLPALLRGAPEMNALVAIGTLAAFGYSAVATYMPILLPENARHVYYEAAASIVTLILFGRYLEARAKGRAGEAIGRLAKLRPDTATVLRDKAEVAIPVGDLNPGDLVRLHPGERIAVDGIVTDGTGYVDESMLTGEPLPVAKSPGTAVTGGTINGTGAMVFQVTATGEATVLARIMRLVEDAQAAKLPIQQMVDKVTMWFVPAVIAVACLTVFVWLLVGPEPALAHALVAGTAVLIIACPCAMGLATPVSVLVGTGRGAELGILFRRGDALQTLAAVHTVAFDKTGTLTAGQPELVDILPAEGQDASLTLAIAAAAERGSEHPLARAIHAAAMQRGLTLPESANGTALPGSGYRATVDGQEVTIGNRAALAVRSSAFPQALADAADRAALQGKTPVFLAINGHVAALFTVADPVRPTARAAIATLRDQGIATAMISGDTTATAQAVAQSLGIETVIAGVLPDGKVAALQRLANGKGIAFVGDGINDAPALAAADVGLAMGSGTDVAIDSAEVVLMQADPRRVADAIALSRATVRTIRQNLFWAFAYNVVLIPVAAGVLYPLYGTILSPILASAAMALSSVFVVTNALRLKRFQGSV